MEVLGNPRFSAMLLCLAVSVFSITLNGHFRRDMGDALFGFLGLAWLRSLHRRVSRVRLEDRPPLPGGILLPGHDRQPRIRDDCGFPSRRFHATRLTPHSSGQVDPAGLVRCSSAVVEHGHSPDDQDRSGQEKDRSLGSLSLCGPCSRPAVRISKPETRCFPARIRPSGRPQPPFRAARLFPPL